jgi:membrane protein DedA with SNARE-associated domain
MSPGDRRRSSAIGWLGAAAVAACFSVCIAALSAAPPVDTVVPAVERPVPAVEPIQKHNAAGELENSRVGQLIERFTYAAIVGVLLLCGLGLPLPEEVPILISAILSQSGHLHPWWALGACMFGVMIGDTVMFFLGRRWGTHVLDHRLSRKLLTVERQRVITTYFERYGAGIIFGARFLPGIRAPLFLSAGTMRVPFWKFLAMDGAAAILSVPLSFWLAYKFTDKLEELLDLREHVHIWAMGLLGAGLLIWLVLHRFWAKRHPLPGAGGTAERSQRAASVADPIKPPK